MFTTTIRMLLPTTCFMVFVPFQFGTPCRGQSIESSLSGELTLSNIGRGVIIGNSRVTQMVWHPIKPSATTRYLYMSSNSNGIRRLTYDETTATFVAGSLAQISNSINGNGLAFHGDVLYASEGYNSDNEPNSNNDRIRLSRIWRLEESGFGAQTRIVEGIPRDDHGANHIQVKGDSLYIGLGVRTRNGAFQTFDNADDYGESAYGGSIAVIDDLNAVPSNSNAAGFYPPHPTLAQYENLINGTDPLSAQPFTTTAANKLRVHSAGTRNPFGLAFDGDSELWFSVNHQRTENHVYDRDNLTSAEGDAFGGDGFQDDIHDQFFRASEKADYGYRNGNWQDGNVPGNTQATDAGFFQPENRQASFTFDNYVDSIAANENDGSNPALNQDYDSNNPVGLGPSSSSNGFDFNQSNQMPLAFQKDAFVARWVGTNNDGGDALTFRDVVSIDSSTGKVSRIATGFRNPLDVLSDGQGNFLVADWGGSIHKISPSNPVMQAHSFAWDSGSDGNYSDRLTWNANTSPADDRLVPHAWGSARYDVTIDQPGADPIVTLDQHATVEDFTLGDTLRLADGNVLTVQGSLAVNVDAAVIGVGEVDGNVVNSGTVSPGNSIGELVFTNYTQDASGVLQIELSSAGNDRLAVAETTVLSGDLEVSVIDGMNLQPDDSFEILRSVGGLTGTFHTGESDLPDLDAGLAWTLNYEPNSLSLDVVASFTADHNHDGRVDSQDLPLWKSAFGVSDQADTDFDGDSDGSDFLAWQKQLGEAIAPHSAGTAVPEPASTALGFLCLLMHFGSRVMGRRS